MEEENKKSSPLTPNFSSLVVSIASTALVKMGLDPNAKAEKNMNLARYNIDLLSLLKEKTANNLTEKESELLDACISDLQVQFVQNSSMSDEKATSAKKEEDTGSTKETKRENHEKKS